MRVRISDERKPGERKPELAGKKPTLVRCTLNGIFSFGTYFLALESVAPNERV